jgi:ssDNA-specific exonuclease RecJ
MSRDGSLHRIGEEEAEIDEFYSPRELIVVTMPEQPQHTLVEALRMFPLEIVRIVAQETRQPNPLRLPAYDQFSKAYRWLAIQPMPLAKDSQLWIDGMRTAQLNANQMRFVIDVLVELSILSWTDDGLVIVKNEQKKSLSSSPLLQRMEKAALQQQLISSAKTEELIQWLNSLQT